MVVLAQQNVFVVSDLGYYRAACVALEGKVWDNHGLAEGIYTRVNRGLKALNDLERTIMIGRYIDGLCWDDIADKVYYSERWCRQVKNIALKKMELAMGYAVLA